MLNVHRRLWSRIGRHGRPRPAVPSAAAAVIVVLATLTACSNDSGPSTPADPAATTTPVETTTGAPGDSIESALYYYPPVEAATLRYESSGGIGAATTDVTVTSVTSGADGQTIAATEVTSSAEGELFTVDRTMHTGADGSLRLDAAAFAVFGTDFTVTEEGDDILVPSVADLESGQESSGQTFVEVSGPGLTVRNDVTYTVTGAGWESVTVPAGTVEAFVVEIHLDITNNLGGATTGTARYWFVPGFGLVRQDFAVMTTAGTTELVSSSVPLP